MLYFFIDDRNEIIKFKLKDINNSNLIKITAFFIYIIIESSNFKYIISSIYKIYYIILFMYDYYIFLYI